MKKLFILLVMFALLGKSINVWAFTCKDATGQTLNSGGSGRTLNVYVDLDPNIAIGQNLVVDLSNSISCKNDEPATRNDLVSITAGSYSGSQMSSFTGVLRYFYSNYSFPLTSKTKSRNFTSGSYEPWKTLLYLTPLSTAGGVAVSSGTQFASLIMYQYGTNISDGGGIATSVFTWNLYANNDVIIPTGGCDVSSRNVTVTLPNYPGYVDVPLTIYCSQSQTISYYLSGTTTDAANTIFSNTATTSAAQGIGVQMTRNGNIIPANSTVSLGTVDTSAVDLGLVATYARTNGQVTAGNVQSIIGVTFVYE